MCDITVYDKVNLFNEKIRPLVDEIVKACGAENIPFVFAAAVKNTESKTYYEKAGELPKMAERNLTEDYLTAASAALLGGKIRVDIKDELSNIYSDGIIPNPQIDDDDIEEFFYT